MTFKYRKKPVVIEAVQYTDDMGEVTNAHPRWLLDACIDGTLYADGDVQMVKTLEGPLRVSDKDYIIRGVKGELYPCKPDIFEATYEKVTD